MFLQRHHVFILLLCLQIVSSLNSSEEGPRNRNDANSTFTQHAGRLKKTKTRSLKLAKNPNANIVELSDKGRFLKTYDVVTCDGYILNIFRMTFQTSETIKKEFPVLLVPDMYQSSDRFVKQNNDHSLAFILQDLGYDVWLANVRGNKYGRRHMYLEPDTDEHIKFFDFSYDEIGFYDIAVIIDYILNDTLKEKVHYIGHSLGGTVFLVLTSIKPEYNEKIETAHLLAPIGYQNYFPNKNLSTEASRYNEIYEDLIKKGKGEIFPFVKNVSKRFSVGDCFGDKTYENICKELKIDELMDLDKQNNFRNNTRGGSIKLLAHLAQNIKYKTFRRWDYGEEENKKHYGIKESPIYNLSHVTVPTKIIFATNDEFVSPTDIADMAKNMSNASTREVERKNFTHQDFIVAPDVMETVYNEIIEDLRNIDRITSEARKELRKEDPKLDPENEEETSTKKQVKNVKKMKEPKNNMKLFIPLWFWIAVLVWLPRLVLPIMLSLSFIICLCCLKQTRMDFKMVMKNDKKEKGKNKEEDKDAEEGKGE